MNPESLTRRRAAAAKGGSARTKAKAAALKALHAARRGVRQNDPGPKWPQTLKRLRRAIASDQATRTIRAAAAEMEIPDRQLRRYLSGAHLPTGERAAIIRMWLDHLGRS